MGGFVPFGVPRGWRPLAMEKPPAEPIVPEAEPASEPEPPVDTFGAELATEFVEKERERAQEHAVALAELARQEARVRAAAERLGQVTADLVRQRELALDTLRTGAADLVLAGARRIAGEALRIDGRLLDDMVAEAVTSLGGNGLILRVAEEDAERVRASVSASIRVDADPAVRGGCIADGLSGTIDASFDAAADAVRAAVEAWKAAG